jgi:uncharacterized membrane protein
VTSAQVQPDRDTDVAEPDTDSDASSPDQSELDLRPTHRSIAWQLVVLGAVAFAASFDLAVERIQLLIDPSYVPSCSLSPVLSCGSVMVTEQAAVFGFPNPLIGVAAFPVVIATGAAMLAGARMRRWYWQGMQVGVVFGVVAIHWLAFQSLYRIEALCPYCMVVWAAMLPLFVSVTAYNAAHGHLGAGVARSELVADLVGVRWWLVGMWFVVITGLIGVQFWDYWQTLL